MACTQEGTRDPTRKWCSIEARSSAEKQCANPPAPRTTVECAQDCAPQEAGDEAATGSSSQGVRAQKGGMEDGEADGKSDMEDVQEGEEELGMSALKSSRTQRKIEDRMKSLMMSQMCEPSVNVEEGLMCLLQSCLESDSDRSSIVVLSGYIEHFESRLKEDLGWGCGWRNIQMLSSFLLAQDSEVREVLFGGAGFVPDIPAMQQWLEIAWAKGFDILGAEYFDWKIAGTHKWIGTTECAALLRSFGVRARIIDFQAMGTSKDGIRSKSGSNSDPSNEDSQPLSSEKLPRDLVTCGEFPIQGIPRHNMENRGLCLTCMEERNNIPHSQDGAAPDVKVMQELLITSEHGSWECNAGGGGSAQGEEDVNHKHMTNWIWNYFLGETGKCPASKFSSRSPLYFQHRGHSRTIVGIERCKKAGTLKEDDYLIVLDPSQRTSDITRSLQNKQGWQDLVKRGMQTLKQAEYQLCYVEPGIAKGEEFEALKILSSVRYMY